MMQIVVSLDLISVFENFYIFIYSDFPLELFNLKPCEYTDEQRRFAITLQLYGPKAYEYLRKQVKGSLPSTKTIQRYKVTLNSTL